MTIEDVKELKEMGFTKEEILSFRDSEKFSETPETPPETPQEKVEEKEEGKEEKIDVKETPELPKELNDTLLEIHKVLKDIQSNNIRFSNYPEASGRTPEEIIGEIISPTFNKRKGE